MILILKLRFLEIINKIFLLKIFQKLNQKTIINFKKKTKLYKQKMKKKKKNIKYSIMLFKLFFKKS